MKIPKWIEDVLITYLTSELTYINGEYPVTVPVAAFYDSDKETVIISTSVAFYNKVRCIKRNPKVSLLYSRSKYSGLSRNTVVLIQGIATIHEDDFDKNNRYLATLLYKYKDCWKKKVFIKMARELSSFIGRILMDWYMVRIIIEIKPYKIFAWRSGDLNEKPEVIEVS